MFLSRDYMGTVQCFLLNIFLCLVLHVFTCTFRVHQTNTVTKFHSTRNGETSFNDCRN